MATSTTKSTSSSSSKGGSTSATQTTGGSTSQTQSVQNTHSVSNTSTVGGSSSESSGKSWASGTVSDRTQMGYDKYTQDYVQSSSVQSAYDKLQETLTGKPSYTSQYEASLNGLYQQIMNRPKFNYDFNADQMYGIYRDQYTAAGQKAMEDTMGQASALTGGYGSSYAQTAGQQTYQGYMQELNNIIPTLREQARSEYDAETQQLQNQYALASDAYTREYGQYRDQVSDWSADRSYYQSAYDTEANRDRSQYESDRSYWQNQYWQEKNAEQSQASSTQGTNWSNSTSVTDSTTNGTSTTSSTNWSNSNTQGTNWSNSSSSNTSTTTTPDTNTGTKSYNFAPYSTSSAMKNETAVNEVMDALSAMSPGAGAELMATISKNGGVTLADGSFQKFTKNDIEAMYHVAYPSTDGSEIDSVLGSYGSSVYQSGANISAAGTKSAYSSMQAGSTLQNPVTGHAISYNENAKVTTGKTTTEEQIKKLNGKK